MKKLLSNYWLLLFFGLLVGMVGVILFYQLAVGYSIRYSGISLFGMGTAGGDHSSTTLALAGLFAALIWIFPIGLWVLIYLFGNLKQAHLGIKIASFVLFAGLPWWTYLGANAVASLKFTYESFRSVTADCVIPNGVNKKMEGTTTKEFECQFGVLNGVTRTYNAQGGVIYEAHYANGLLHGTETTYFESGKIQHQTTFSNGAKEGEEVFYDEDGNTNLYIINHQGNTRQVYYQGPEKHIDYFGLESQNFFCNNPSAPALKDYRFTCVNNRLDGEVIKYDAAGTVSLRAHLTQGGLNGIYEQFTNGKLFIYAEFKNGKLDGRVELHMTGMDYEGQYTNGLQNGLFRIYLAGEMQSEVVFEEGQVVKVNK